MKKKKPTQNNELK